MSLRLLLPSVVSIVLYWIFFIPDSKPGITTLGKQYFHHHSDQFYHVVNSVLKCVPTLALAQAVHQSYQSDGEERQHLGTYKFRKIRKLNSLKFEMHLKFKVI